MADIRTSLATAAQTAGLAPSRFREVEQTRWKGLLANILDRFTVSGRKDQSRQWLWNDLKGEPTYLHSANADDTLKVLSYVLPARAPVWFVAEDFGRRKKLGAFWLFESDSDAIVSVLAEHHLFEFYIVDRKLEWMVGENHEDVLFSVGEPTSSRLGQARSRLG